MLPDGLVYRPDFLTFDEEGVLLELLDEAPFEPIVMRGVTARRKGMRFKDELPEWLEPLRTLGVGARLVRRLRPPSPSRRASALLRRRRSPTRAAG